MLQPIITDAFRTDTIAHGFFTRVGGVSAGIYAGLNAGLGSNDQREVVLENRRRVTSYFGTDLSHLAGCHQVHSPDVVTVTSKSDLSERPKADAVVTATPGIILSVLTADCGPVLFADPGAGVVGAAHAGWKGATGGVLQNTIAAMEKLGAKRDQIIAVLGPTISQANYEVGPEFVDRLQGLDASNAAYFRPSPKPDHSMFNLPALIVSTLQGLEIAHATWTGHCTYADEDQFFSYRRTTHRSESDYGRQMSAIMLR
ncbi:MAG: peptidoglycan editing factor PgeF [Pseudomonadota bacterium]